MTSTYNEALTNIIVLSINESRLVVSNQMKNIWINKTIESIQRLRINYIKESSYPDNIHLELGYSANYFIRALEQLSAEIFDKSKQVNFVISIYRVLTIGEHSPWRYYNSKRIVILKDETATYDSELHEVQLKQKHEIINFILTRLFFRFIYRAQLMTNQKELNC